LSKSTFPKIKTMRAIVEIPNSCPVRIQVITYVDISLTSTDKTSYWAGYMSVHKAKYQNMATETQHKWKQCKKIHNAYIYKETMAYYDTCEQIFIWTLWWIIYMKTNWGMLIGTYTVITFSQHMIHNPRKKTLISMSSMHKNWTRRNIVMTVLRERSPCHIVSFSVVV